MTPEIAFFLPLAEDVFARLPRHIEGYLGWQDDERAVQTRSGRYHWVLQTCLHLKQAGLPVRLVNRLPAAGVIVTHMDCIPYGWRPPRGATLVVMLVDCEVPHPWAHLHVTHNPVQALPFGLPHAYVPPWPQIGLVPRDPARGDLFQTIGYLGFELNLDPALRGAEFGRRLAALGLRLQVNGPDRWHDFSDLDAVLAVRSFGRDLHLGKPALKLYNAWAAGVPAIIGHESACRAEGDPGRGYIEATSVDELVASLELLARSPARRSQIVDTGRALLAKYCVEATLARWRQLIDGRIAPLALEVQASRGPVRAWRSLKSRALERILWRRPGRFVLDTPA